MALSTAPAAGADALVAPKEVPVRYTIPELRGGLRRDKSAADLADNEAVDAANLHYIAGELVVRFGYRQFSQPFTANIGTNQTGAGYLGQAAATYQLLYASGVLEELLVTTLTMYRWASAVLQWQLVSFGQAYTTVADYPAGTHNIIVSDATGLAVGQLAGLILDDGTQLITTISGVAGTLIALTDAVPSGRISPSGAAFSRGAAYTGDSTAKKQLVGVTFPITGEFIFCNGVDPIQTYFSGVVKTLAGLPNAPVSCRAMCVAHEQLLIANLTENGVSFPTRVRVSDQAAPTVWTPGTGLAALYPLDDTPDAIKCLKVLGPYVAVYRDRSIMRGIYLGLLNQTWYWEYTVTNEGVISQGAVSDYGTKHLVVGHANVYSYDGTYTLTPLGDAVYERFLAPRGDINVDVQETLFTVYAQAHRECWIVYAQEGSAFPRAFLLIELDNSAWFRGAFADMFVSASPYIANTAITWATAVGTWAQQSGQWDAQTTRANVPNILLAPTAGAPIRVFDYAAVRDDQSPIPWLLTTKQFGDDLGYTRWETLILYGFDGGETASAVEASIDEGNTWTVLTEDLVFGEDGSVQRVYIDNVSSHIQFRLTGTDQQFSLRGGDVIGVQESAW
jgi:hypothetical protein